MKILVVSKGVAWRPSVAGEFVYIDGLCRRLAAAGHEVTLSTQAEPEQQKQYPNLRALYVPPSSKTIAPLRQFVQVGRGLSAFDVIHVHGGEGFYFALRRRLRGFVPVVATVNVEPTRQKFLEETTWRKYERKTLQWADKVIGRSEHACNAVSEEFEIPPEKVHRVYPAVSQRFFDVYGQRSTEDESAVLPMLLVGALERGRGVDVVITALSYLIRHRRVALAIVGPEREGARKEYFDIAQKLGVHSSVVIEGCSTHLGMPSIYRDAALLLHPAKSIGFPLAVAEAMATGLPVIASRAGAVPEIITDEENGFLVEHDDPQAFAQRIRGLIDNAELRRRVGAAAHEEAKRQFSWDRNIEQTVNTYEAAIK